MADTMRPTTASPIRGTTAPVPTGDRKNEGSGTNPLGDVKELGTELAGAVRDSATSLFEEQRNRAADEIAALGKALAQSARSLDQNGGTVARYADQAAQQIGDFATNLRDRSWNEMAGDVENFARRWPVVFMAAAVGVGFAAGRFLMASAARPANPAMGVGDAGLSSSANRPAQLGPSVSSPLSGTGRAAHGTTASRENG